MVAALLAGGQVGAAPLPPWDPTADGVNASPGDEETATNPAEPAPTNEGPADPANAAPAIEQPPASSAAPSRQPPDVLPPPPTDPNDAPFMRAPNNQLQTTPPRTRPDIRRGWSARRRLALTVAPAFASLRLPFQGRTVGQQVPRLPGAGVDVELDVQAYRWIWFRAHGIYSGHPVDEVRAMQQDMEVVQLAPRGTIHVAGFGAGPVFALDLGRFLPLIEVGVGGLQIVTPNGGVAGQRGEACRTDKSCDVGLNCNSANVCEVRTVGEAYLGLAVDLLVRRHLSLGAQFRYNIPFNELKNLNLVPGYLVGTLRLSVRF